MFEDFFYLGKITKHFGLKGELVVYLDTDEPQKYHTMESVFLNIAGEPVPFFVEEIKVKTSNQLVVKFADIDGENFKQYIDCELYLPLSMLPKLTGNRFYFHEVVGFEVNDVVLGKLGTITGFLDYPAQAIMQIQHQQGEILLPVVDDYIVEVDREKKRMKVQAPADLIALYIESIK